MLALKLFQAPKNVKFLCNIQIPCDASASCRVKSGWLVLSRYRHRHERPVKASAGSRTCSTMAKSLAGLISYLNGLYHDASIWCGSAQMTVEREGRKHEQSALFAYPSHPIDDSSGFPRTARARVCENACRPCTWTCMLWARTLVLQAHAVCLQWH